MAGGLLLTLGTLLIYAQVGGFAFISLDDSHYIYDNPMVRGGLTARSLLWGLTTDYFDCWHPLTWWSHMLDCEVFGLKPGWHHLENLGFHIANTLLVFGLFRRMTGCLARSFIVAALFAWHPTHVESVAWVAERKDVLSTFFWLLAVGAYVGYAKGAQSPRANQPEVGPRSKFKVYYSLSLAFFGLGLMSKPMVVTLPFVLLLLDFWPLGRISDFEFRISHFKLLLEKAPFLALALFSSVTTFRNMNSGSNIVSSESISWGLRLTNVPVSYLRYLGKLFWPVDLAAFYPLPPGWAGWKVAGAVLLLGLITVLAVVCRRSAGYLLTGWLMFLGILVPVIGIVAMGYQSVADRYLYVPSLGIFVAVTWLAGDLTSRWRFPNLLVVAATTLVLAAFGCATWIQVQTWRNSNSVWTQCFKVNPENWFAHYCIGCDLQNSGRVQEAIAHYQQALNFQPNYFQVNLNLGVAHASLGNFNEATNWFAKALRIRPHYDKAPADMGAALFELGDCAGALTNFTEAVQLDPADAISLTGLGRTLACLERSDEAVRCYLGALRLDPTNTMARYHLGLEYLRRGAADQAVATLKQVVGLDPESAPAHLALASALQKKNEIGGAVIHYREAVRLNPGLPVARNNLAWIMATYPQPEFRNGTEAVQLAEAACEQTHYQETVFLGTLAAAYAENDQFEKAVETARRACDLAAASGQAELLARNQKLLHQFQNREPCRDRD